LTAFLTNIEKSKKRGKKPCKPQGAGKTRWSEQYERIRSVVSIYPSIIKTLKIYVNKTKNIEIQKLLEEIGNKQFVSTLYILHRFLKITHWLTLVCQVRGITFAAIDRSIIRSKFAIKNCAKGEM
jgi:hypothetical protein